MIVEQNISWELALRVWWHFFWRYAAFGLLAGIVSAIIIGAVGGFLNLGLEKTVNLAMGVGGLLVFYTNIWVVRRILTKKNGISKYRLVLIDE